MASKDRLIRQLLAGDCLGDSEINDLRRRLLIRPCRYEDVRRFDVSMDDPFLVRVLNRVTDFYEQFQTSARRQGISVAIISDFLTLDQFHNKIWSPTVGRAGIKH